MERGEQVFRGVQCHTHRRQIDHPRGALEGVKSTKNPIDPLGREPFALHRDQIVGGLLDQLARFGDELLMQGVHGGAPERTAA